MPYSFSFVCSVYTGGCPFFSSSSASVLYNPPFTVLKAGHPVRILLIFCYSIFVWTYTCNLMSICVRMFFLQLAVGVYVSIHVYMYSLYMYMHTHVHYSFSGCFFCQ